MSGRFFPCLFSKSCSVRKKKKKGLREECERTNKFPSNSDIFSDPIFRFFPRFFSKSRSVRKKKKKGLREECERNNVVPDAKILETKK